MPSIKKMFVSKARDIMQLREFFKKNLEGVGFSDLDIQESPLGTRITIKAARPGLVIGKKGSNVKMLTEILSRDFKIENPQIDVIEVANPELDAQIMAERLASALEKGQHYRRAAYGLLRRIMRSGADGCEIIISGKITSQRARYQKMRQGVIKRCGEPVRYVSKGIAHAKLKSGILGIRISILPTDHYDPKSLEYRGREALDPELVERVKTAEIEIPVYTEKVEKEESEEVVEIPEKPLKVTTIKGTIGVEIDEDEELEEDDDIDEDDISEEVEEELEEDSD